MYTHTVSSAARATGIAKSRIRRAIEAGRLTAYELGTGDYAINPVELRRVFPTPPPAAPATGPNNHTNIGFPVWDVS
jgi:excisionase family DNA binding protein